MKRTRMTLSFEHLGPDGEVLSESLSGGILDVSGSDTDALAGIAANTVKDMFPKYIKAGLE